MSGTVARVSEISARSDTSFEDAVNLGVARANATLRGVASAWIKEQSVDVEEKRARWVLRRLLPTSLSSQSLGLAP